jgi:beta-xylosidase
MTVLAWCLVLCSVAAAVSAALVALSQARGTSSTSQPPRDPSPQRPGIDLGGTDFDLPDPFMLQDGHAYALFVSTAFGNLRFQNVPYLLGRPGHWGASGDAMPHLPAWALPASAGGTTWAPFIYRFGQKYVLYFSSTLTDDQAHHCIGTAISDSPTGPFAASSHKLICQLQIGGDIDAQVVRDVRGPSGAAHPFYLIWKSDNNSLPGQPMPEIWAAKLSNNGRSLSGPPVVIFKHDEPWQGTIIEAPQMALSPSGQPWLFYSAGTGYYLPQYAMGAAPCKGPLGPCVDDSDRPLLSSNAQGTGPGEETVFAAPGSTWLLYNPWHANELDNLFRPVEAARVGWDKDGPYIAKPGHFPDP